MQPLNTAELDPVVAERIIPFFREVQTGYPDALHSLHIVGSAITPDFRGKTR